MLIARSLKRVGRSVLKELQPRSLSGTTSLAARPRPRPAPKKPMISPQVQKASVEEQLPPVALLKLGNKSGALDIEPDRALSILRDYVDVSAQRQAGTWEKRFCEEEKITHKTLMMLALVLLRCKEKPRRFLGMTLLFSASAIGEPYATLYLLTQALNNKDLDRPLYTAPFNHLRALAAPPHSIIEAMVLLGKIYESQGEVASALQMYQRAASTPSPTKGEVDEKLPLPGGGVSSALVRQGLILEDQGNKSLAKAAFRRAALEHDDPVGYYHLARMEEHLSETQRTYLLKSASSGDIEAATGLGDLHLQRAEGLPKTSGHKATEIKLAKEWLYLSATAGEHISMLRLAQIFVMEGKIKSALPWLEKAESSPSEIVAEGVKQLRDDIANGVEE